MLKLIKSLLGGSVNYKELLETGAVVIDFRTTPEFNAGHLNNSENIPLETLFLKFDRIINKEVIVVCKPGARAARAKAILKQNGIVAHNAGAWQNLSSFE
jgi:rhodanese-related sulfurtransferase